MRRPSIVHRNRKHRDGIAIVVSIAIALAFSLPIGSAKASSTRPCICPQCGPEICGGGGGGGSGPIHDWVVIDLFSQANGQGHFQVRLNATNYIDGDAVELQSNRPVPISIVGLANLTGKFTFDFWESDLGNFSSSTATSTTFTPYNVNGGIGEVAAVVSDVNPSDNFWSGYVMDTTATSTVFSCVGGTNYIQPYQYYGNGWPTVDYASSWVSLGGYDNSNLLQAGMIIKWTGQIGGGGYQLSYYPFVQAWNGSVLAWQWSGVGQNVGQWWPTFTYSVCDPGDSPTVSIEALYQPTGGNPYATWWNESVPVWVEPYKYQACWIVEDPLLNGSRPPLEDYSGFQNQVGVPFLHPRRIIGVDIHGSAVRNIYH